MLDRQTCWRLLVGAVAALSLHAALLPALGRHLTRQPAPELALSQAQAKDARDEPPAQQPELQPPPKPPLGRLDAPETLSLAWIAYDDFQQLVGSQAQTLQPVVQELADPVPNAPVAVDATPPSPRQADWTEPSPEPSPVPTWQPPAAATEADMQPEVTQQPSPQVAAEGDEPDARPMMQAQAAAPLQGDGPAEQLETLPPMLVEPQRTDDQPRHAEQPDDPPAQTLVEAETDEPTKPTPATQQHAHSEQSEDADQALQQHEQRARDQAQAASPPATSTAVAEAMPAPRPVQPIATAAPRETRPTSAPRDDREVDPTEPDPRQRDVRPGQVVTVRGIEIKTTAVRIGIASRLTAVPRRALARISFDKDGAVRDVQLVRSTGYPDIDAALIASFYRWRATGITSDDGFTEEFTIIQLP